MSFWNIDRGSYTVFAYLWINLKGLTSICFEKIGMRLRNQETLSVKVTSNYGKTFTIFLPINGYAVCTTYIFTLFTSITMTMTKM